MENENEAWSWAVPILDLIRARFENQRGLDTTAFFYFKPGADPLGMSQREEPQITQIEGVNLSTQEDTQLTFMMLQEMAFEYAPDAVMIVGEGWDFSHDQKAMEQAHRGEEVQPEQVSPCIFCTIETPATYYMSMADVLQDRRGNKTFIPHSLHDFEEVPNEQLQGRYARILPANKIQS